MIFILTFQKPYRPCKIFMVIKTRPGFKRIVKHFCSDVNTTVKLENLKSTNRGEIIK